MVFEDNHSPRPCLDNLSHTAKYGHNVAAYLVAILLYRRNDDALRHDTARRYIRQVKGEEESRAAAAGGGAGPPNTWLRNKVCVLCHQVAANMIKQSTMWGNITLPPPARVRGDLPCAGGICGRVDGWEGRVVFCSEDCRLSREFELFAWELGIRNYM
jgi:hypothetical protein